MERTDGGEGAEGVKGRLARCAFLAVDGREEWVEGAEWRAEAMGVDDAEQRRRNTVEVAAALALIARVSAASHSAGQWQQGLQHVLLAPTLRALQRVVLLVPTAAQQQAAQKAWGRLQGQQSVAAAAVERGTGRAVEIQVVVAGSSVAELGAFDLALVTAVCAPPPAAAPTDAVLSLWPPASIQAVLAATAPLLLVLGHEATLSTGSDTWRHMIGHMRAHSRWFDLERCEAGVGRAIAARRAAVEDMRQMLEDARGRTPAMGHGDASPGAMGWHGLLWTGLFSPAFGESLQQQQSVEVLLLLWRILQGRHPRTNSKSAHRLPAFQGRPDEVSIAFNGIVHVDTVGDLCLIWSTDVSHESHMQVVRLWALVPESHTQPWLHRIRCHLACYSPAYLHYCALHQYHPSSPRIRVPARMQEHSIDWWQTSAGKLSDGDVVTPPKFITLQPAMMRALLQSTSATGGPTCALSSLPFEVNAEERAAILCPSSIVVHGRSGTGKTTVIIHRALRLHRLARLAALPAAATSPSHGMGLWGSACEEALVMKEGGVGAGGEEGRDVLRQVVVTRSLQLCASIHSELSQASSSLAALDAIQAGEEAAVQQRGDGGGSTGSSSNSNSNGGGTASSRPLLMREDLESALMGGLPACIAAIPPTAFPLALTLSKLLRLLDASVSRPFLAATRRQRRQQQARQRVVLAIAMSGRGLREAWEEGESEGAWAGRVQRKTWEARRAVRGRGRDEPFGAYGGRRTAYKEDDADEDGEVEVTEEEEEEEEEEVEVDYERFRRQYWRHLDQRATRKVVVDAAFVFREITSHIKGSLQALQSPQGHVDEEEYVRGMVGSNQRTSAMGEEERRTVYSIFQAYERRKRQLGEYDSGDLVMHLHREIRRMQDANEPWWSLDLAPTAPPWAVSANHSSSSSSFSSDPSSSASTHTASPFHAPLSPRAPVFHCVAVDEVQDLTQAQLALLPLLCTNTACGFVLAGDTAQAIAHGVDFRFEDLARVVYSEFLNREDAGSRGGRPKGKHGGSKPERGRRSKMKVESIGAGTSSSSKAPVEPPQKSLPTFQLVRNYRTHNGVLRLAHSVVRLLQAFFPTAIDRLQGETSMVDGATPLMASVPPTWMRQLAQGMPLSATQAIVVRSREEKAGLAALFPLKPVILTVDECKGLEFEDVILFNFFASPHCTTPWQLVYGFMRDNGLETPETHASCTSASGSHGRSKGDSHGQQLLQFDELKHCSLCSDLKRLYVAITRAKQRLWVLDEEEEVVERAAGSGVGVTSSSAPMRDLWAAMGLVAVRRGEDIRPEAVKRVAEAKDWRALGFRFFDKEDYEAAQASFERAGDTQNAQFAHAMWLYEAGMGHLAPPPASAQGRMALLSESAQLCEKIQRFLEAGRAWVKARSYMDAVRVYLTLCRPPEHVKAAQCYEKLAMFPLAADLYAAAGDMYTALSVCLRACIYDKGLSLLDTWQEAGSTSASAVLQGQQADQLRGWYVLECARRLEGKGEYDEMLGYVRKHHCMDTKRRFLERGRHLLQLAVLEGEEGDRSQVAGLLIKAGRLLEASRRLWQDGYRGRALVCFVRHLHWRVNAAGRGAWRVGMSKGGGEGVGWGGGVDLSEEEVEMAGRLRGVQQWGSNDRMHMSDLYEGCDLLWARVEMNTLLFLLDHHKIDATDVTISAGEGEGEGVSCREEAGGAGSVRGDGCAASVGEWGRVEDVETEASLAEAWCLVSRGQVLPAGRLERGKAQAGEVAAHGSGEERGGRASGGVDAVVTLTEEIREAEELWRGEDVMKKGAKQVARERSSTEGGMVVQQRGREEWKGAEQLRSELMLAYAGLQVALRMLHCAHRHLNLRLEHISASRPCCLHGTAASPTGAAPSPAAGGSDSVLGAGGSKAREAPKPPFLAPPAVAHVQHRVALWWHRWSSRLTPLLVALRDTLSTANSHLPHAHAAFALLSISPSLPHRLLSSPSQLDDVTLPWVKAAPGMNKGGVERVASTGSSGVVDGGKAVKMVLGVWEREYEMRRMEAQKVVRRGVPECLSRLRSCLQQVVSDFDTASSRPAPAGCGPSAVFHHPLPASAPLLTLLPLIEHSLSLLPATMFSCSRFALIPSFYTTPLHLLFTALLLHPNGSLPSPAIPCWPHHLFHPFLHEALDVLLLHVLGTARYASGEEGAAAGLQGHLLEDRGKAGCNGRDCGRVEIGASSGLAAVGGVDQETMAAELQGSAGIAGYERRKTMALITCIVNACPQEGNARKRKRVRAEVLRGMSLPCDEDNPLMALSPADLIDSLTARALLHQASPTHNVHGDAGRLLLLPWKSALLPLTPSISLTSPIPLLPTPPPAIFNLPLPLADLAFKYLCQRLPALHSLRQQQLVNRSKRHGRESLPALEAKTLGMVFLSSAEFHHLWPLKSRV